MVVRMADALETLRAHEADLRKLGIAHAAIFGSVARGEAGENSDIDVLIDLDPQHRLGIFQYARLKMYVADLLGDVCDVVNRRTLKPLLRDHIVHDSVNAF